MKKKLTLFTRVLPLVLFVLFISCSDDDKDTNNNGNTDKIVGEWVLVGYTDEQGVYHTDEPTQCSSFTVTFNGDGKGKDVDKDCDEADETENFQWKANGANKYVITYSDEVIVITTNFTNDNKVVIKYDDSAYTDTFMRK
ncbi:hypothetical protein D3C87_699010 [compost metagenome]